MVDYTALLDAFLKVSQAVSDNAGVASVLAAACKGVAGALQVAHSGILLFDPSRNEGRVASEFPSDFGAVGTRISLLAPVERQLIEKLEVIQADDLNESRHEATFGTVLPVLRSLGIRSILVVPIISSGRAVGSFSLDGIGEPYRFSEDEVRVCQLFAAQIAAAIENVMWNERMGALREAALSLSEVHTPENMFDSIVRRAVALLRATGGGLYKWMPERTELNLVTEPYRPRLVGTRLRLGEGIAGKLIESNNTEPVSYPHYSHCDDRAPVFLENCPFGAVIEMLLKMPNGRIFGVLYVDDQAGREFTAADTRVLQLFTAHALAAIELAESTRQVRATQSRWELVQRAMDALVSAPTLRAGCDQAAQVLAQSLDLSFCRVLALRDGNSAAELIGLAVAPTSPISKQRYMLDAPDTVAWFGPNRLLATQASVALLTTQEARDLYSHTTLTDLSSAVLVGFRAEGNLLGVLELGFAPRSKCDASEQLPLGQALAERMAPLFAKLWGQDHDRLHRARLIAFVKRCNQLKPGNGLARLEPDFVRMACELGGANAAVLYSYRGEARELKFLSGHGPVLEEDCTSASASAGRAARSGILEQGRPGDGDRGVISDWVAHAISIPLKAEGRVSHVLSLWYSYEATLPTGEDLDLLDYFAQSGALTFYTAELLGPCLPLRKAGLWSMVSSLSTFMLEAQSEEHALNAVLTGVTAGYGLRFNRAAVFLLNERADELVGVAGIGELERTDAEGAWDRWKRSSQSTIAGYLGWIAENPPEETVIGRSIRLVSIPVSMSGEDAFSQILFRNKRKLSTIERPLDGDPTVVRDFVLGFQPSNPLHLVRIDDGRRSIGVLVADKKFTPGPTSADEEEFLITLANLVGRALPRIRGGRTTASLGNTGALYNASSPGDVLQLALDQICIHDRADGTVMFLMEGAQRTKIISSGRNKAMDFSKSWSEEGWSARVLSAKLPYFVEAREDLSPEIRFAAEAAGYRSSIVFPMIAEDEAIGVVWIHHVEPQYFDDVRIAQLQAYVNHAALAYSGKSRLAFEIDLLAMMEKLSGIFTPGEVTKVIASEVRRIFRGDMSTVWPYHVASDSFKLDEVASCGWPERSILHEPRLGRTTYKILVTDGYYAVPDVARFELMSPPGDGEISLSSYGVASYQGVALATDDDRLGVIYVNYRSPRIFTKNDRSDMMRFAALAAVAFKRARLMDQAIRLKQAARVVAEVTASAELTPTLTAISDGIQEALSCASVILYSYNPDRRDFEYPPGVSRGVKSPDAVRTADQLPEASIVRHFLQRDGIYVVRRVSEDPLFRGRRFSADEGVRSCAVLPLILPATKERVGVMFINYGEVRDFRKPEVEDIEFFAMQGAVACRHAQIVNESRVLSQQQGLLVELSRHLLNAESLAQALCFALDVAATQLNVPFANVVLPRGDKLLFMRGIGWPSHYDGTFELEMGAKSHAGFTILERVPIQVDDFSREVRFDVPSRVAENNIRSGLGVPIEFGSQALGAMLVHTIALRHFTAYEVMFLSAVANQLAITLRRYQDNN